MKEKILEELGAIKGTVCKVMPEIEFGAIWDKKNKRKVFYSTVTKFSNTNYSSLNEGDSVEVLVVRTSRGLFAKNLSLAEAQPRHSVELSPSI